MRREGVERDTKQKEEGVKRRGGVSVDVVGVRNENVWYGRYGGAARKSRCEGEENACEGSGTRMIEVRH